MRHDCVQVNRDIRRSFFVVSLLRLLRANIDIGVSEIKKIFDSVLVDIEEEQRVRKAVK